jgi:phospholipid/cholesterol/gamma-HCH transport system permease protein
MIDKAIIDTEKPMVTFPKESGGKLIVLVGLWSLRTLATDLALRQSIKKLAVDMDKQWDISRIERLDSAAAFLLWQAWGEKLPVDLIMRPEQRRLFKYCHDRKIPTPHPMLPYYQGVALWAGAASGILSTYACLADLVRQVDC